MKEATNKKIEIQRAILEWASENLRDFPWRENRTPYNVMVVEFLLKRTTASAVARIYVKFLKQYPRISELAKADVSKLKDFLQTIGYHKLRAKELVETASYIQRRYGGKIPKSLKELKAIPNIGPYTAGAIRSLGYNERSSMVDSNVERILRRVFKKSLPEKAILKKLRVIAKILVPENNHATFNLALLDLGANICSYRKTRHNICPLRHVCDMGEEVINSR